MIRLNELESVKITELMSIFTSKKVRKFLIKNLLTNSDPKRRGGGNGPASCQLRLKRSFGSFSIKFEIKMHLQK